MKLRQLSRQNTANCRAKIRPTVASKYGQLAHFMHTSVQRMGCCQLQIAQDLGYWGLN